MAKYRSGAALLENFFVDYRGGASTRPGTKYILQCFNSTAPVRLIPFQASFAVGYICEFGDGYVRFYNNGAPVLETATTITSTTPSAPWTFNDTAHGYGVGDWVFIQGNYYRIGTASTDAFTLTDLFGNAINVNPFTIPASVQRVYVITSPYTGGELAQLKFAQSVNNLILCHPNHLPYSLVLNSAANWTLGQITFGATLPAPTGQSVATTLSAGDANYAYVITAVDTTGQESAPSNFAVLASSEDIRTTPGTNTVSWSAVGGAVSYNVYRAEISLAGAVPAGSQFGFVGNCTDVNFIDSNIGPDFSQVPPLPQNPFVGTGVASVAVTAPGSYTPGSVPIAAPTISFSGGGGSGASAIAFMTATSLVVSTPGAGYTVGQVYSVGGGTFIQVTAVDINEGIASAIVSTGGLYSGSMSGQPVNVVGSGVIVTGQVTLTFGVASVGVTSPGTGYGSPPTVTFSGGGATGTAAIGATANGNPTVPGFFQQRLVLAGLVNSPQEFIMSKPGAYYNFDISTITQPDDSITATLVSGQLNTIRAMIPQTAGLLFFTDRNSWLVNGGTSGSPVTPTSIAANPQSFSGISDVPPIVANFDVLYIQAKGSVIRDSSYNIYANVFTGTDISIISSHLFYGYQITEWAWAEEPFKVVWAVRNDGQLLSLTFLKEQEFIGWAHHITNGVFQSVATVVENTITAGEVDAIYVVVTRFINGQLVKYIERIAERTFVGGVENAWCVDCGIQYTGTPALTFSGAGFLGGQFVTGLQTDNLGNTTVITPFVMPTDGTFTLPGQPFPSGGYSNVIIGLAYTCSLQTLPLDLGDPTIQGKVKKINSVDVRVADTLGLSIGSSFDAAMTPMKDLIQGNVSSMLTGQPSQVVTNLVNGDARTILDPTYTVPGQFCIQQSLPYPATVLGVFPEVTIGDGGQRDR
jgi:hypothetical protein